MKQPPPKRKTLDEIFGPSASQEVKPTLDDIFSSAPIISAATKPAAESWSTRGKALSVAREALGQGAMLGFGDEAEALASALLRGRPYAEERERIRGEMREFKEAYPKTATGASLAGGFLTPVPGGATRSLARTALRSAVEGGVSGVGSAEGDIKQQLLSGALGAATGGVLGPALAAGTRSVASRVQRGGAGAPAGVTSVARRAAEAGMQTPEDIQRAATSLTADVPAAQVVDVLGTPAVKRMRTIRAYGGEPGQQVEQAMAERVEAKPDRLLEALRRTTGREREDIVQTIDDSIKRGKDTSAPLYEAFYAEAPKASPEMDSVLKTPFGQSVMERARRNAANDRRPFIEPAKPAEMGQIFDANGNPIPVVLRQAEPAKYHPQTVDDIKKAMDDIIYESRFANVEAGQGGIRPGEKRTASALRKDFVNAADESFPKYAEARSAWAGEKALRDALESGAEAATKRVDYRQVAKDMADLDQSELEFFQRGYLDGLGQKIDDGRLRMSSVKTKAFQNMLSSVFGADATSINRAIRGELEMVERAGVIRGGSQTFDKAMASAEDVAPKPLTRMAEMVTSPVRSTMLGALGRLEDQLISPRFAARRGEEVQEFLTPASQIGPLLQRIEREMTVQRRAGQAGAQAARGAAVGAGLGLGRLFSPQE